MPLISLDDDDNTLGMLRESANALAERIDGAQVMRLRRAGKSDLDRSSWTAMAEAGWLGLLLPEELGGLQLGSRELVVLCESLGRGLLTEPYVHLAVFSGALLMGADHGANTSALAGGLVDGSRIVATLWQTERGARAELEAIEKDGEVLLNGCAGLVSAAQSASDYLVLAQSDGDCLLVHLPADTGGIGVSLRASVDDAQLGAVDLDGCSVPSGNVLARGPKIEAALAKAIETSRLAIAAELAGIASKALEATVDYTRERIQFGKPIASFQAIQHRLVDMWSDAEFACSAVTDATEKLGEPDSAAASQAVLAAKARAGDAAIGITRRAIQLHGAMGFTDECDIGLYMKRAINLNATLGQPEELRLQYLATERAA